ncbi:MAG: transposase [Synergistaceae bacterium]|nr:transposase [Synergistaceae bacterium]
MSEENTATINPEKYDYGKGGAYYVTVCVKGGQNILWKYASNVDADSADNTPPLSGQGEHVAEAVKSVFDENKNAVLDKMVVMPNHIHLTLFVTLEKAQKSAVIKRTVSNIMGQIKRATSKDAAWQESYYDRLVHDAAQYRKICEYIEANPSKWTEDCYFRE